MADIPFMPTPGFPVWNKEDDNFWILHGYAIRNERDIFAVLVIPSLRKPDAYLEVPLSEIGSIEDAPHNCGCEKPAD